MTASETRVATTVQMVMILLVPPHSRMMVVMRMIPKSMLPHCVVEMMKSMFRKVVRSR